MRDKTKNSIKVIAENMHLSNIEIGKIIGISKGGVRIMMRRYGIKRSDDLRKMVQKEAIINGLMTSTKKRSVKKELNPNWKGGISKNHYHYKKLQVQRYPERIKARNKVHLAVKSGKLLRQPCLVCGELKVFAHHKDYSKPLEVLWFCRAHHRTIHGEKS